MEGNAHANNVLEKVIWTKSAICSCKSIRLPFRYGLRISMELDKSRRKWCIYKIRLFKKEESVPFFYYYTIFFRNQYKPEHYQLLVNTDSTYDHCIYYTSPSPYCYTNHTPHLDNGNRCLRHALHNVRTVLCLSEHHSLYKGFIFFLSDIYKNLNSIH